MGNSYTTQGQADSRLRQADTRLDQYNGRGWNDPGISRAPLNENKFLADELVRRLTETRRWVDNPRKSQFTAGEASVEKAVFPSPLDLPQPATSADGEDELPPLVPSSKDQGFDFFDPRMCVPPDNGVDPAISTGPSGLRGSVGAAGDREPTKPAQSGNPSGDLDQSADSSGNLDQSVSADHQAAAGAGDSKPTQSALSDASSYLSGVLTSEENSVVLTRQSSQTSGGEELPSGYSERSQTLGLAFHAGTGYIYTLSSTDSGLLVSRRKIGEEADLSFTISPRKDAQCKIIVVQDYVITYSEQQYLKIHNLHGVREKLLILKGALDLAGSQGSSMYCLLKQGFVVEYSVPDLELMRQSMLVNPKHDIRDGTTRIVSCSTTGRIATLDYKSNIVTVYDVEFKPLQSITIDLDVSSDSGSDSVLCLNGDEVIVGEGQSLHYVDYERSLTVLIRLGCKVTGLCYQDADHVLVAKQDDVSHDVTPLDLRDVRRCPETVFWVQEGCSTEARADTNHGIRCSDCYSIRINKYSGELMQVSRSGHVTVYGRDVTRSLEEFQIPLPDGVMVGSFDTTDEGEVVVVSEDDQLLIFSSDRQLAWSARLGQTARYVACSEEQTYVLTDDHVISFTREAGQTEESRPLPLGLNHDHEGTRLAVHGDVLYLLVPWKQHVLKMELSEPDPTFTPLIHYEHAFWSGVAVTDDGDVVLGGMWRDESGSQAGLCVYSSEGQERRRVVKGLQEISDLALRPGGGVYIRASDGLHFLENF